MMKLLCRTLLVTSLGLACQPGIAASADELILACEKLQRAEDRATCLKEAVRASAGAPASSSARAPARSKPASRQDVVLAAADSIMRSLRRLNSATSVGITMRDYSQLVVTESAIIDEALRSVPRGPFEDHVRRARDAYIDARKVWSEAFDSTYASIFEISISPILRRYQFDTSSLGKTPMGMKTSSLTLSRYLSPIWTAAADDERAAEAAMAFIMNPPSPATPATPISTPRPVPASTPAALTPAPAPLPTAVQRDPDTAARRQATPDDQRVLIALRRLDATADTGPGLNEYAKLSTAGVAEVDAALGNIPNDAFRNNVLAARQAYVDAHQVWYWAEQYQYLSQFADVAGPTLRTYGVVPSMMNSTGIKEMRLMPRHIFLFPIWSAARIYIDAAEASLLSPEAAKPLPDKVEIPAEANASRSAAALRKAEEIRKAEALRKAADQCKADGQSKADTPPNKQAP